MTAGPPGPARVRWDEIRYIVCGKMHRNEREFLRTTPLQVHLFVQGNNRLLGDRKGDARQHAAVRQHIKRK